MAGTGRQFPKRTHGNPSVWFAAVDRRCSLDVYRNSTRPIQAALEAAQAAPPDLMLSDVMMPRLDGFGPGRAPRPDERPEQVDRISRS
jgi:CheY-like chemotaxis protein